MSKKNSKSSFVLKPGRPRDPAKGRLSFKTGVIKPRKQRSKVRGDKYFSRELRRQLGDS